MSDYNIRRATVDDFDGVMDIGDVYMGIDYLRHRFHIFMDDRNIRSYVYIIGEEVGFCSIALIDDGLTFLIRASRVKNGFRGQGVYGRLLKHIYAEYKDVDSIKYDAMTTDNYNCEDKKSLENAYVVMCRKTILSYRFKVEDIDPPLIMTTFPKEVNSSTMMSLFEDEKTRDTLFPEGKILIDWVPLRLVPSNIKYILAVDTFALQSMGDNSEVSLLSVGTPTECQMGIVYITDIFGSDVTALRHHIIRHLEHLKTWAQTEVVHVFQIVTSQELRIIVEDIMKDQRISSFHMPSTDMFSLERGFL